MGFVRALRKGLDFLYQVSGVMAALCLIAILSLDRHPDAGPLDGRSVPRRPGIRRLCNGAAVLPCLRQCPEQGRAYPGIHRAECSRPKGEMGDGDLVLWHRRRIAWYFVFTPKVRLLVLEIQ